MTLLQRVTVVTTASTVSDKELMSFLQGMLPCDTMDVTAGRHLAIQEYFKIFVLLYGVWHACKNVSFHLHCVFFHIWIHLDKG